MSKGFKVGVIGLGMGRHHLRCFHEHPSSKVVAIADQEPQRLKEIGDQYGIKKRYSDGAEMIEKEKLDVVSIATPNKFHCPLTVHAFKKGCHVFCEKPMAMTVEEAEKMNRAAPKAKRSLMINFSYRFSEMSFALKQQVDSGVIGNVYFGRTVWHRRRGIPKLGGWFTTKELSGGGPLIDLGVHRIDLALWLMGYPEPQSVFGSAYNVLAKEIARAQNKQYSVEDMACGLVKFKNGATLIVEASWALNVHQPEYMETALYGDKGGLVHRNTDGGYTMGAELYLEEGGSLFTKKLDRACVKVPTPYGEFIDSLVEGRQPIATGEHGLKVQKILNGLYQSAEQGAPVTF